MKKIITIFMLCILLLTLCSCGIYTEDDIADAFASGEASYKEELSRNYGENWLDKLKEYPSMELELQKLQQDYDELLAENASLQATKDIEPETEIKAGVTFIANKNTGKLHKPTCSSVNDMKEKNKAYLTCTRDEAIAKGYDPCARCNP